MGLVNEVLLDLEKRGASAKLGKHADAESLRAARHEHSRAQRIGLRVVLGALLAVSVAGVSEHLRDRSRSGVAPAEIAVASAVSAAPESSAEVAVAASATPETPVAKSEVSVAGSASAAPPPAASLPLVEVEAPPAAPDWNPEPPIESSAAASAATDHAASSAPRERPDARGDFERSLARDPGDAISRVALAGQLVREGRSAEARELISDGLTLSPDDRALIAAEVRFLAAEGNFEAARERLESGLRALRGDPGLLALLAGIELQTRHPERALDLYRGALRAEPERAAWWLGLGVAFEQIQRGSDAEVAYQTALATPGLDASSARFAEEKLRMLAKRGMR